MKRLKALTFVYMSVGSLVIGALIGGYLQIINWLIDFFWTTLPAALHLPKQLTTWCILLPMGLLIGLAQRYIGQYPLTIAEVLSEVKLKGHFDYHRWWKILLCGLLILGAGGSIGPEASASGLAAGMIYWLGCRYKLVMAQKDQLAGQKLTRQVALIVGMRNQNHLAQIKVQPLNAYFATPTHKKIAYRVWTLCGIIGLLAFFKVFPQEGVIGLHLPHIDWQWQGLLVVIPAMIVGWLFSLLFIKLGQLGEYWFGRTQHFIIKGILGGIMLAIAALLSRDVLFSGEFSIQHFAQHSLTMAPLFLISFAVVKAFVTNVGFCLGWRGGTIFPAIFSSLAMGAFAAHYLGWMPQLTMTIVVTVAITVIIERPLLTAVMLWLLLPVQFAPIILIMAYLTNYLKKKFSRQ